MDKKTIKGHRFGEAGVLSKFGNILGGVGGMIGNTVTSGVANYKSLADLPESATRNLDVLSDLNNSIRDVNQVNNFDDLQNLVNSTQFAKTNYSKRELGALTPGEMAGNIIGQTHLMGLQGFMDGFGSTGNPWVGLGTAIAGSAVANITSGFGIAHNLQKASGLQEKLNTEGAIANRKMIAAINDKASNISTNMANNARLGILSAFGGPLHSGNFDNGVRFITEGGSHESNPFGGVLQGIASDGLSNLVEEGEVIYNDYVYSRRLKVPKIDNENLGLKKDKEYTYAEAAEYIQRESEERPNDVLSKRNLEVMMGRLQESQDELKQKRNERRVRREVDKMPPDEKMALAMQMYGEGNPYAFGGVLGHEHSGLNGQDAYLNPPSDASGVNVPFVNIPVRTIEDDVDLYTPVRDEIDMSPWELPLGYYSGTPGAVSIPPEEIGAKILLNHASELPTTGIPQSQRGSQIIDPFIETMRTVGRGSVPYTDNKVRNKPLSYEEYKKKNPSYKGTEADYKRDMFEIYGEDYIDSPLDNGEVPAQVFNVTDPSGVYPQQSGSSQPVSNDGEKPFRYSSGAQALRAMPILGNAIGALYNLFDKPNYANTKRTEDKFNSIPHVSATPVGGRLPYIPIDINYIATQQNNNNIGARRAALEAGIGYNIPFMNYQDNTALGNAIIQAMDSNNKQRQAVEEFNLRPQIFNAQQALAAQHAEMQRGQSIAQGFLQTGQLRDQELARLQNNRSVQLTSLFNNLGALGQDKLARDLTTWLANTGAFHQGAQNGLPYIGSRRSSAYGGKLNKKGGSHA